MRAVIQRVRRAQVTVDSEVVGSIDRGLLVLLGVHEQDTEKDLKYVLQKILGMRIFEDEDGKMNLSIDRIGGELLVVSQFTLYGDCRKGRRPSFTDAARPEKAERLYEMFCCRAEELGVHVAKGKFAAMMDVELINDGPVTILLDSTKIF